MDKPLVSVLISAHNEEKFIKGTLKSVFDQTYRPLEIVVVDDGSTDGTTKILKMMVNKHDELKVIFQNPNIGLTKALNMGIDYCTGKYIARLDASDFMMPDRIKKQVKFMEQNMDHGVVGTFREEFWVGSDKTRRLKLPVTNKEMQTSMVKGSCIAHSTVMIRTNIMKKYKYNPFFKTSQDYDLWVRIGKKYKLANIPEYLIRASRIQDSITFSKSRFKNMIFHIIIRFKAYRNFKCPKWYIIYMVKPIIETLIPKSLIQKYIDTKVEGVDK